MRNWWRARLGLRPWWMNALMFFCAYMAIVYMPWDFFAKPVQQDEEIWFGFMLYGWAAKTTEPLHWAIYAAGAYGFWRMRSWMWPWAAVYSAQVAIAMLVWSLLYRGGLSGWFVGLVSFALLAALTRVLWRARDQFKWERAPLPERYGEWALITGASSGIGAEFARALAREGMSCVLTARREDRLQALAGELEKAHKVSTRVVAADLAEPQGADQLASAIQDIEIGVLVNNAGFGYAGRFDKQETQRLQTMIQLNCVAPVVLTSHLLSGMRARRRGAIVITGSVAGRQPLPWHGVYSATKAFDLFFGESLWGELQGTGIDVVVLEPGLTRTEFQEVAGETAHAGESPAKVVKVALDALGQQPSVVSGWFNWLRASLVRLVPRSLTTLIAGQVVAQRIPAEMR